MSERDRIMRELIALLVDAMPVIRKRSPARARRMAEVIDRARKATT